MVDYGVNGKQNQAVVREYLHAIEDGNLDLACRIWIANPDLQKSMMVAGGSAYRWIRS